MESQTSLAVRQVSEYYVAAEPPVRCGESHCSGRAEPPMFILTVQDPVHRLLSSRYPWLDRCFQC